MTNLFRRLPPAMVALAWLIVPAAGHAAACSAGAASLKGWYGVLVSGNTVAASGTTADTKYLAGAVYFDGVSALSGSNMYGAYGVDHTVSGSYGVNADCTLTLDMTLTPVEATVNSADPSTATAAMTSTYPVAVKTTGEAVGIETDAAAVAKIVLKPQTGSTGANFTAASMNGSYVAACYGPFYAYSDLNVVTFSNGTGNGVDPYENNGSFQVDGNPYTVTYTVNPDGTFAGVAEITDATLYFNFSGVISNSGSQLQYFYTNNLGNAVDPNTDAIESCSGATTSAAAPAAAPFTLTPAYSNWTLQQNMGGTNNITITPAAGFTGSVSLSVSGVPSGVGSALSGDLLVIYPPSTTPTGTYPLTVTGTSGSSTVSTTISLTITGGASFSLTPTSSAVTVARGHSGTDAVSVVAANGFSGAVSFGISGLPAGATGAFSPASSATGSTLTIAVAASTAPGTYSLTLTGTAAPTNASQAISASSSIKLTVQ